MFLNYFYEKYQVNNANKVANTINKLDYSNLKVNIEKIAYKNNVCVQIITKMGNYENYNTMMNGCELNNQRLTKYKDIVVNSNSSIKAFKIKDENIDTNGVLYGINKNDYYVFVYSPIEEINSTSIILKNQLIYIILIVMLIAVVISYFLSKKITGPIKNITNKAKELGNGNYNLSIEESDIKEIDELATVLNEVGLELSKTDELRRDLMANVSHDLKTPLTMIKAYAEMVRDISYKDDSKREEHLNIIIDETDRLTILVNDILEMAKEEANADFLKIEEFDLVSEVNKIVSKYEIIKETENYNIICDLPKSAIVHADKSKINQVVYNLINNAINYTGDDKVVKIKITDCNDSYLVEIIDTGKGISNKDLKYIWNRYYKKEKNHKRNVVGSGVGLSIVKSILIRHDFEYGVKSKKNHGTTFYFKVNK
jgi:signal transduction histidine kinase